MKLKKIASLALAGIMAVSMLAGCKDGGNGNSGSSSSENTNTSTGLSAEVLALTALSDWKNVKAEDNAKLNDAIKAMAKTSAVNYDKDIKAARTGLVDLASSNELGQMWNQAEKIMAGATAENWGDLKATDGAKSAVRYDIYYVSGALSDAVINGLIADKIDDIATNPAGIGVPNPGTGDTYEYTVSVAKADWLVGKEADSSKDGVLVGIAIALDYTEAKL